MTTYQSVQDFQASKGITLPRPHKDWCLVKDMPVGEIHGIPTICGQAVATNGIIVIIETVNGELFNAHLSSFVKHRLCKGKVENNRKFSLLKDFSLA